MSGFRKALDRLDRMGPQRPGPPRPAPAAGLSLAEQLRFLTRETADPGPPARDAAAEAGLPGGEVERTAAGSHYRIRRAYGPDHCHGIVRLARISMADLQGLLALARCPHPPLDPERIVFLDTETTGIHGGAGTCPFLIGAGFFRDDDFQVVQLFIRDFDEEPSMLAALGRLLASFDLIVTYNGAAFDLPLVESRSVLARVDEPRDQLARMAHFDLLPMARRLWRAAHGSCRLTALEASRLRFLRGPDIPGSMIPAAYFDYLRGRGGRTLAGVFSHNAADILSLAALTIHAADRVVTEPARHDDPLEVHSLGRIFDAAGRREDGCRCYEQALAGGLPEPVRLRTLERLSVLYRLLGARERSLRVCERLMAEPEFSLPGYEGAAIHCERLGDLASARRVVEEALARLDPDRAESSRPRRRLSARLRRLEARSQARGGLAPVRPPAPLSPRAAG